jgi:hypothetical protein
MDSNKLLEGLRVSRSEAGGLSMEDVRELTELYEKIKAIDLDKAVEERVASRTPVEQLVEDLKANVPNARRALAKPKPHYHTVRAKKRKHHRDYVREVYRPRRKAALAEKLSTPEGWWEYLNIAWDKRPDVKVELTYDEFVEYIYPVTAGVGLVFVVLRYDTNKPVRLDNIYIKDTKSRRVLFDGKEHVLRSLGYII